MQVRQGWLGLELRAIGYSNRKASGIIDNLKEHGEYEDNRLVIMEDEDEYNMQFK